MNTYSYPYYTVYFDNFYYSLDDKYSSFDIALKYAKEKGFDCTIYMHTKPSVRVPVASWGIIGGLCPTVSGNNANYLL